MMPPPSPAKGKGILDGMGPLEAASSSPEDDDLDPLESHLSAFNESMSGGDMKGAAEHFRAAIRACGKPGGKEEY